MDDYISKPIRLDELQAVLERWGWPVSEPTGKASMNTSSATPNGAESEPVLDAALLAELRTLQEDGEPDVVAELVGLFLSNAPTRLAALQSALAAHDRRELRSAAHSLKGSCGVFGARRLAALCQQLEKQSDMGSPEALAKLVESVHVEFGHVRVALAEMGLKMPEEK